MASDNIELTTSNCPECGAEKQVTVSISSSCRECGLDCMYIKYEIPTERIKSVLSAIFKELDKNGLQPAEGVTGINSYEELMKRLNP